MLEALKQQVYEANMKLVEYGLVIFTWGNVSGIDRESGIFAIKPSGVDYSRLRAEDMVLLDLDGNVVDGSLNPSSDTPTHLELYRRFPAIGGVAHTHSTFAVAFAQAARDIQPYGTTHADFAYGAIPCTRDMTEAEIEGEYELNTGKVIAECFDSRSIDPEAVPAVLVRSHGPFTWGKKRCRGSQKFSSPRGRRQGRLPQRAHERSDGEYFSSEEALFQKARRKRLLRPKMTCVQQ